MSTRFSVGLTKLAMVARDRSGETVLEQLEQVSKLAGEEAARVQELARAVGVRMPRLRAQRKTASDPRAPGLLRSAASSAWRIGGSPPKPQTTNPKWGPTVKAKLMEPAKPPSNQPYYRDILKSLYDPARGFRQAAG